MTTYYIILNDAQRVGGFNLGNKEAMYKNFGVRFTQKLMLGNLYDLHFIFPEK